MLQKCNQECTKHGHAAIPYIAPDQAYFLISQDSAQRRKLLTEQTLQSRTTSLNLVSRRLDADSGTALDYWKALGLSEQAKAEYERT